MLWRFGEPCVVVDAGSVAYLWQAFLEMGPAKAGGMGREPWDWTNVDAFAGRCLPEAEAWEIRALADMSKAYCRTLSAASDPFAMSPVEIRLGETWRDLIPPDAKPGEIAAIRIPDLG